MHSRPRVCDAWIPRVSLKRMDTIRKDGVRIALTGGLYTQASAG